MMTIRKNADGTVDQIHLPIDQTKTLVIQMLQEHCTRAIRSKFDEHDERNAANGILPQAEADAVVGWVRTCRDTYKYLKNKVESAQTHEELFAIRWPKMEDFDTQEDRDAKPTLWAKVKDWWMAAYQ